MSEANSTGIYFGCKHRITSSIKVMFDLPYDTHRCLIEPITGTRHVRIILMKRFLSFTEQIQKSQKQLPKQMLNIIRRDVRSTTGSNLRQILLHTNKDHVEHLKSSDILQINYHPIKEEDRWKTGVIKEIVQIKNEKLEVEGFSNPELEEILQQICSA